MEEIQKNIYRIEQVELLPVIMEKKNDMWRLVQICCAFVEGSYEITYSFATGYEISNYRLVVGKEESVPSISRVYKSAILYENEMRELFGLNVEHMKVDYHDKLYRINEETPFLNKEERPLLLQGQSHFPSENKEERPLLLQGQSHFPSENKEDK